MVIINFIRDKTDNMNVKIHITYELLSRIIVISMYTIYIFFYGKVHNLMRRGSDLLLRDNILFFISLILLC